MKRSSSGHLAQDVFHRRSIRLGGYDYASAGAYFVTMVTHQREYLFGAVINGKVQLNELGLIAEEDWLQTSQLHAQVEPDVCVVTPNQIHAILVITERGAMPGSEQNDRRGHFGKPVAGSLATLLRSYKSDVTKRINGLRGMAGTAVWQRNYYEHIIRNASELDRLRAYIENNPSLAFWRIARPGLSLLPLRLLRRVFYHRRDRCAGAVFSVVYRLYSLQIRRPAHNCRE